MRKRPLGQNFLIDTAIADSIIEFADIKKEDDILEIGPGKAVLTQRLLPLARSLTTIELDSKLCITHYFVFFKNLFGSPPTIYN